MTRSTYGPSGPFFLGRSRLEGRQPQHRPRATRCALQRGEQAGNVARNALLGAGLPIGLPGTTIDRQCGSGQQAVHFAAQGVIAGAYDIAIACGVESMSRVPIRPTPPRKLAPIFAPWSR